MIKASLLPADTYIVTNKTITNDQDRRILTMLYQPLIGSDAINLYFTLWSYLDKSEILSCEWTHHHLMASMRIRLESIAEAREKLEAIGLVSTFIKRGDINTYVYELYSPISAYDFFNNPILSLALSNNIGQTEYEKVISYFRLPKITMEDYEDITCLFNDVFEPTITSPMEHIAEEIKRRNKKDLQINSKLDLTAIIAMIPEEMLNSRSITKETKELIYKLSFVYSLDNDNTIELIKNSINERKIIDKDILKDNCRNFFKFEHSGKLPSLAYKNQPEYLRKTNSDKSNKDKMIYTFETTSPSDFICSKNSTGAITQTDKDILAYLLLELDLNPGVVNVLVDYVLKINNNKLNKAFVEAIASQWGRSKIETVEEAMELAEKEYKNRHKDKKDYKQFNKRIVEDKPEWFDKHIDVKAPCDSRKKEIEEILNDYK